MFRVGFGIIFKYLHIPPGSVFLSLYVLLATSKTLISYSVSSTIGDVADIPVRLVSKIISTVQCRLVPHVGGLQLNVTPGRPGHFELNRRKSFPKPLPAYTRTHQQTTKPFPAEEFLGKQKLTCRGPSPQPLCTEFERAGLSTEDVLLAELTRRINPVNPLAVCPLDPGSAKRPSY